jgi:flagellar biosynthesis protein FlhB
MSESSEDRTEAGSERHLEQARESGNVALSREAATFASMAAVVMVLVWGAPYALPRGTADDGAVPGAW